MLLSTQRDGIYMKKFNINEQNKLLPVIIGIEILIMLVLIVLLFVPGKKYLLNQDDNTITLPYGHYYLKCDYSISSDTDAANYLWITDEQGKTEGILHSEDFVHHEKNTWETEFWITKPSLKINLEIRKQGQAEQSEYLNYADYEIKCTSYTAFVILLILSMVLACTVAAYLIRTGRIKLTREKVIYVIIMSAIFIISCIPLFGDSLIKGDDTVTHLIRIEGIKDGYLSGQFPVKVEPTLNGGYGYAFSTYYGGLFYNIPVILRLMGFTLQGAYKAYIVVVNFATVIAAYYSFKVIFKKPKLALISTIMYSLSLIRIVDLYQRGAVGEFTALIFIPLIAAGLWKIYATPIEDENYKRLWVMPVIGYFGVIESHVLSTELCGVFTVLICLMMFKKTFRKKTFLVLLKIVLISVVLNIAYLLPFIESYITESTYINSGLSNAAGLTFCLSFTDVFKFFFKFIEFSAWRDYMVPGLGPTVIPIIGLFIYTLIKRRGIDKYKSLMIVSGIITIITVVLSLDVFPYERILTYLGSSPTNVAIINRIFNFVSNMGKNIQFAMRFLTIGTCTYIIFIIALLSQYNEEKLLKIAEIIIVALTVVQYIWASVLTINDMRHINFYTITENDKEITCEIGNYEYLPLKYDGDFPYFNKFREDGSFQSTNAEVTEYEKEYINVNLHVVTGDDAGMVELPLLYYRGYKAVDTATGKEIKLIKSESALLLLVIDSNYDGNIRVYYPGKIYWHIADAVSVVSFVLIVLYSIKGRRRAKVQK